MLWLALSIPPPAIDHPPVPVLQPEVVQRLLDPPRCLAARCIGGEWRVEAMPVIPAGQLRISGDSLPGGGGQLRFGDQRRDWMKAQGSNARVGMQYGTELLKTQDKSLRFWVDTGYRLKAYADDGVANTGMIVRGQMEWKQSLGDYFHLAQTTKLEAGQHSAFLRNSLLLKVQLQPALTLSSGIESYRDSERVSRNKTDATLNLRYVF